MGLTVIVKFLGDPSQPFAVGVTVIVAISITLEVLVAVNDAILPLPVAANPILVLLFVQLNVVPLTELLKFTAEVAARLHNTWFDGAATIGVGLTLIVKLCALPEHPLAEAVTVMVAVTATLELLTAIKGAILPVPDAAKPMPELLLVQVNVAPLTELVKFSAEVIAPLQTTWSDNAPVICGDGFTIIIKFCGVPLQEFTDGITVIVAVSATDVAFVALKGAIFPVPLAASPIPVLLLLHVYVVPLTELLKFIAVVTAPLQND